MEGDTKTRPRVTLSSSFLTPILVLLRRLDFWLGVNVGSVRHLKSRQVVKLEMTNLGFGQVKATAVDSLTIGGGGDPICLQCRCIVVFASGSSWGQNKRMV